MTVMNGTLAFDVAGGRNDRKCVDIDPETIFEEGVTVSSPYWIFTSVTKQWKEEKIAD